MKVRRILIVLLVVGLLLAPTVGLSFAQKPAPESVTVAPTLGTAFTYQGRLTDGGNPANGAYDFQFKLYAAASGGSQVGSTVTKSNVQVTNGFFTVQIDFGNVFNGQRRWLEIAVRHAGSGSYTTLSPRQELTAAPNALYSLKAPWSGLTGVPAGFADDVDNDTTYTAGTGLTLSGTQFRLNTGYTDGRYWKLGGNNLSGAGALGTITNKALNVVVNNQRALRIEPGSSPNIIGGYSGNSVANGVVGATIGGGGLSGNGNANRVTVSYGTIGGGFGNTASGPRATVGGGHDNAARDYDATVGGGAGNIASGGAATVGGGMYNTASSGGATVGGGGNNTVSGGDATVGGGYFNTASGNRATVGGGHSNTASGLSATVGGGCRNDAAADFATIAGGGPSDTSHPDTTNNRVTDDYGAVGGGGHNQAGNGDSDTTNAQYATVGGGVSNEASAAYSTVGGGLNNTASGSRSTVAGGENNTASGYLAVIGGGFGNTAGFRATVGGGDSNTASGSRSTISGGNSNEASGDYATVGGGKYVMAGGSYATIGGGFSNYADGNYATIGGGEGNMASRESATVCGGFNNSASGIYSTVPGGYKNTAYGAYSFATGRQVEAKSDGCFIWGDSTEADTLRCTAPNMTIFRSSGGFYIYTNGNLPHGVYVAAGGGSWHSFSDRNMKENIRPVDPMEVLNKLAQMPVSTWNYKTQDDSIRHMGPMAQDFYAAFGLGDSDKAIATVDAEGVTMAAIQGLYKQNQEQARRIAELESQNAELISRLQAIEAQIEGLKAQCERSGK